MNLLDKFSAVEIKADNRISEEDKEYCNRQQLAFDKSGPALRKIATAILEAQVEQSEILQPENDRFYKYYIVGNEFNCDSNAVLDVLAKRNNTFISNIIQYFSRKYKVDLDTKEIQEHLIPAPPKEPNLPWGGYRKMSEDEISAYREQLDTYKGEKAKYESDLRNLPLRYERVVDEIFVQLGGFSFQEQAMNEFLERTWNCCHRTYGSRPNEEEFEIKNDTLRLIGYWVSVDENKWMNHPVAEYKPSEDFKTLLNALAYYECEHMDEGYRWFPELFKYNTKESLFDIPYMEKVKSIKLFKNGRADIKFRSTGYVQEFVEQYMRRRSA